MGDKDAQENYNLKQFGLYKPIMSLTKENFKEMQLFFLLKIIADNPDGITAYQLQTNYHFPRSNAIRMLNHLETEETVVAEEKIIDGRTNKMIQLTEKGFLCLLELKEKWAERFMMMEELTANSMTITEQQFYLKKIESLGNKEERIAFLETISTKILGKISGLTHRINTLESIHQQLEVIIDKVKSSDVFESEDVAELFDLIRKK